MVSVRSPKGIEKRHAKIRRSAAGSLHFLSALTQGRTPWKAIASRHRRYPSHGPNRWREALCRRVDADTGRGIHQRRFSSAIGPATRESPAGTTRTGKRSVWQRPWPKMGREVVELGSSVGTAPAPHRCFSRHGLCDSLFASESFGLGDPRSIALETRASALSGRRKDSAKNTVSFEARNPDHHAQRGYS